MTPVHFVPCGSHDDPELIGRLALALFRKIEGEVSWASPGTAVALYLDDSSQVEANKYFKAWSDPLARHVRLEGRDTRHPADAAAGTPLAAVTTGSLHSRSGWEGAVHSLGLGCVSPEASDSIREGVLPHVDRDICGGCGMCVTLCGNDGIRHNGHVAVIKPESCLACGDCLAECYLEALKFPAQGSRDLIRRIASSAARVMEKSGPVIAFVFLLQGPRRKLASDAHHIPQADLGILVGTDPVAIDQVAVDLIAEKSGQNLQKLSGCPENPLELLRQAEEFGAGNRQYEIHRYTPDRLGC